MVTNEMHFMVVYIRSQLILYEVSWYFIKLVGNL